MLFPAAIVFNLLLISVVSGSSDSPNRQLITTFLDNNVTYTQAKGPKNTLHYIITTHGQPAVFVAKTNHSAKLIFHRPKFYSKNKTDVQNAFEFTNTPDETYCVIIKRLLEYNDLDDKANLNEVGKNETLWKIHELNKFEWQNLEPLSDPEDNVVTLQVNKSSDHFNISENGYLRFQFKMYGSSGRTKKSPHLAYTPESAQFDFILNDIEPNFPKSRYALEVAFVSSIKNSSAMTSRVTKSIDDEHTPGVFKLYDWIAKYGSEASYVQWKPVCYTSAKRDMKSLTDSKSYDIVPIFDSKIAEEDINLAYMYYGAKISEVAMSMTNVSFGLTKDKFYANTKYSVWSVGVGFGKPPEDVISTTIIIIIIAGFGLPAAIILFGGIFVIYKKRKNRYVGYEDLTDSDAIVNT